MRTVPSTHPGEELLEILDELDISVEAFAQATGMSVDLVSRIVEAKHPITPDIASRIAKELDMTPESWLHLQSLHDEDMKMEEPSEVQPIPQEVAR
ncbi:MAG: HigA family addiction module antitoxin [Dehalococcoidia bacterium]|nr:HigA family addiction module antitoxin [Dehalococcoidia bacterium]